MQQKLLAGIAALCLMVGTGTAQTTKPISAPSDTRPGLYAITASKVFVTPDQVIDNATILVRDGKVESVGTSVNVPAGAVRIDAAGKTIVPAFIDPISTYGQPEVTAGERNWYRVQYDTKTTGPFSWNESLKSEYDAAADFQPSAKRAEALRKLGYGTVLTHRPDGISRGSAAVVALGDKPVQESLLKADAAHVMSFEKGTSQQAYPSSLMGMIALLRQTYLDAAWYAKGGSTEERNLGLEAWIELQRAPQLFAVGDELEGIRALKIAEEFGKEYILYGNGDAYQRLDGFAERQKFIVPLNFPDAYDVTDPYDSRMVDFADMLHWELADANAVYLSRAGHEVAITLDKLGDDEKTFFERLDRVRAAGMSEADLLRALTLTPARYAGLADQLGTLERGKLASFVVLDEWPVAKDTKVFQTWVQGEPHEIAPIEKELAEGSYRVTVGEDVYTVKVDDKAKAKVAVGVDTTFYDGKLSRQGDRITLTFPADTAKGSPVLRLGGRVDKLNNWSGMALDAYGTWLAFAARFDDQMQVGDEPNKKEDKKARPAVTTLPEVPKPFTSYGTMTLRESSDFVVRGATVWTSEAEGILQNADVYVAGGKIAGVGVGLSVPRGTSEVDATGKHITAGIIDEHSHVAISRGVNEGSQESTAEVRIGDVINSEDVNIYRHLAGGVTAIQQLHGSANPIGGQSALIKMRWGMLPDDLKIEGADGYIKFALGENVKQSNWGVGNTRYPQTRMGVEQVFDDYFTRAAAYAKTRADNPDSRRDLDLEALAEILNRERFISCHSYRQSEINMLMKVAERHDFTVNTFTHILEGYKVADKMAEHGAGASTFSDWWAYKFEVWDAIPENGPIMHEEGLTVAYNSDDAELGRRLNQEAAKAVQYGGLSEEEAWKFVTLNPAKLLHLDERMGSIKVGKDADLVLWNDHPMSIYALAETTWVDGVRYFDRSNMKAQRVTIEQERNRLAQAMLADKNAGKRTQPVEAQGGELWHCDSEY